MIVENECILYDFLRNQLKNKSKNNIKSLLVNQMVLVNNKIITKYDHKLNKGDIITIMNTKLNDDIKIVYEDKYIIAVYKPSNLLTISNEKEKEKTLYHIVSNYLKAKNKNNKIFIVHRLDYETCGLVMFAKDEKTKTLLQNNWDKVVRNYVAIVKGKVKEHDTIKLKLIEEGYNVYVSKNGKEAITSYELIKSNEYNSLVKINIKTGRKNQIRISFKEISHPIIGDSKYGVKEKIMCLCANELEFNHPITQKKIILKEEIPSYSKKRFNKE